jgi:hypothetical protein
MVIFFCLACISGHSKAWEVPPEPDWLVTIKEMAPGFIDGLYHAAYFKQNKQNMDRAVSWMYDRAETYMNDHPDDMSLFRSWADIAEEEHQVAFHA